MNHREREISKQEKKEGIVYLSKDLVQTASLPRLGPVLSTMGSYMKYQKLRHCGRCEPEISRETSMARSPARWTLWRDSDM